MTALWSSPEPIPVFDYVRGQGLAAQAQPMSFRGVDLDVWGRQLLALLDLVLSADYAVSAYRVDPDAYGRLVAAKNVIAEAVRDSVTQVTAPGTASPADLAAAQDALYRRLLTTLSEAYQVATIVAVPVAVTAPADWGGDTAPRLHGQPVGTVYSVPAESAPRRGGRHADVDRRGPVHGLGGRHGQRRGRRPDRGRGRPDPADGAGLRHRSRRHAGEHRGRPRPPAGHRRRRRRGSRGVCWFRAWRSPCRPRHCARSPARSPRRCRC